MGRLALWGGMKTRDDNMKSHEGFGSFIYKPYGEEKKGKSAIYKRLP